MIEFTSKQKALGIVNQYLKPLDNETFNNISFVSTMWIFTTANSNWHIDLKLDKGNNQLRLDCFNRHSERTTSHLLNLRANVTELLSEMFYNYKYKVAN